MKLLRRILIAVAITSGVVYASVNWIAPVAVSFYVARKALPITKVVPTDLKDQSISQAPGQRMSYFGYEFEVPWSDLDESQTVLYPKDKVEKTRVDLRFRSGLRLLVLAPSPGEWVRTLSSKLNLSPAEVTAYFGDDTMKSDYNFIKTLYEFSPTRMNHWASIQGRIGRDQALLIIKSIALPKAAENGIFKVEGNGFRGFQQGDPQIRQNELFLDLYSDEGSFEMIFFQKDYAKGLPGVTQPEINRIIHSFHRATTLSTLLDHTERR